MDTSICFSFEGFVDHTCRSNEDKDNSYILHKRVFLNYDGSTVIVIGADRATVSFYF